MITLKLSLNVEWTGLTVIVMLLVHSSFSKMDRFSSNSMN